MQTYYVRISPNIEQIAREIHHAMDWQQAIFDDVTSGGKRLDWVRLEDSDQGPTFALYGDTFVCLAGPNWDRKDGLFIFRVENADVRRPRQIPGKLEGKFELIRGVSLPKEAPGATLIPRMLGRKDENRVCHWEAYDGPGEKEVSPRNRAPEEDDYDFTTAAAVCLEGEEAASFDQQLVRTLRADVEEVLAMWRPQEDDRYDSNPVVFLKDYRDCWARFDLGQFVATRPGIRIRNILIGQTTPNGLSRKEFREITDLFGLDTVHRYLREKSEDRLGTQRLLKRFGSLPLPEVLRVKFWQEGVSQQPVTDFKRELQIISTTLKQIKQGDERRDIWATGIRAIVRQVSEERQDGSLIDLNRAIEGVTNPLVAVQEWVARLEFRRDPVAVGIIAQNESEDMTVLSGTVEGEDQTGVDKSLLDFNVVEKWILGQTVGELSLTNDVLMAAKAKLSSAVATISQVESVEDILAVIESVSEIHRVTTTWMEELPEHSVLEKMTRDSREIYKKVEEVLGVEEAELFIESNSPSPEDLREAIDLAEKRVEWLTKLPDWLAGPQRSDAATTLLFRWLTFLLDPSQRRGMIALLKQLHRADQDGVSIDLGMISRPESSESLDDAARWAHFDGEFKVAQEYSALTDIVADDFRPWVVAAKERKVPAGEIKDMAILLEKLRPSVQETTFSAILERVEGECDWDEIDRLRQAIEEIKQLFNRKVLSQSLQEIDAFVASRRSTSPDLAERSETGIDISFRHDWVGPHGERATLVYHEEARHWWTSVPLVAKTSRNKDCNVELSLELKHGTDGKWPPYNAKPLPVERRIKAEHWKWNRQSEEYEYPIELRLPFKKKPTTYLAVAIQALDRETKDEMGGPEILKWESFSQKEFRPITLDWASVGELDYVEKHPIGVQRRSQQLLNELVARRSVAVIAPRRFGKTTLVRYIQEEGDEREILVPEYVTCTSFQSSYDRELDYYGIWGHFSQKLQEKIGSGITIKPGCQLPDEDGFDFVRRAAKEKGYKALVFVFDEAQLLFPRKLGGPLGDRLKDRLERTWGIETDEMVPVVFVFCGLPDFADRVPNLMGALQVFEEDKVTESELYALILNRTAKRMQSTRAARKMLSDSATNLFVLRTMMEKMVELVNGQKRAWFNLVDAKAVHGGLLQELESGSGGQLARYVRDCINEAETVNEWRPKREYPVALAFAHAQNNTVAVGDELLDEVVHQLNSWGKSISNDDLSTLKYDTEMVREQIAGLRHAKILNGNTFTSAFFRSWLLGVVNRGVEFEDGFSDALVRGAQVHIRKPEVKHEVHGGSQASICRFTGGDGVECAYRELQVEDAQERHNFIHNLKMLHRVLDDANVDEGRTYIYNLENVGVAEDHPDRVVEIYRWITGRDLHGLTTLAPPLVAELGCQLAKALRLIHGANILHRDIRPRNVILEARRKQPVLIDFGLASLADATGHTLVSDEFAAPEVRKGTPTWTPAADVYSLGATLQALLSGLSEVPQELEELLARCTDEMLDQRPSSRSNDLVRAFENVKVGFKVDRRRRDAWDEVRRVLAADCSLDWFDNVLQKFRPTLEAHALGLYVDHVQQTQVVADFFNQTVEACPNMAEVTLFTLENELSGGDSDAVRLVRDMRNLDSHSYDKSDRRYQRYSGYSGGRLRKLSTRAGEIIGERCGLENLPAFVNWVYGNGETH